MQSRVHCFVSYQDEEAPPTKNDPSWLQTILWFPLSVTDAFPAADDEDSFEIPSEICGDGEENILVTAFRTGMHIAGFSKFVRIVNHIF